MSFASIRIITDDVDRLVSFYEDVIGHAAARQTPEFAQFAGGAAGAAAGGTAGAGPTLAIAGPATVAMLGGALIPSSNRSVVVEFEVADVDAEFRRLVAGGPEVVLPPTTMPWGNRSALLRDPDGNLVNLFSRPAPERG